MSGPTKGTSFVQTKPVTGKAIGGLIPGAGGTLPATLLAVPTGKTFRLKDASISLAASTDGTFAPGGTVMGIFASIQDSNGNTWAECEVVIMATNQVITNGEVRGPIDAVLPAGTTLTINAAGQGAAGGIAGLYVRVGGGATWEPS